MFFEDCLTAIPYVSLSREFLTQDEIEEFFRRRDK